MRRSSSALDALSEVFSGLANIHAASINDKDKPWGAEKIKQLTGQYPSKGMLDISRLCGGDDTVGAMYPSASFVSLQEGTKQLRL